MSRMWSYPEKWYHYPIFVVGFALFWLLIPFWMLLCKFYLKEDSAFIMIHVEAMFYNPWLLWE